MALADTIWLPAPRSSSLLNFDEEAEDDSLSLSLLPLPRRKRSYLKMAREASSKEVEK